MNSFRAKIPAVVFCAGFVFALISGCESGTSKAKKYRIVAANLREELKKQESEYKNKLKIQKKHYEGLLAERNRKLEKCQKAKNTLEQISSEGIDNYMKNVVGSITKENQRLKTKNEELQLKIKQLKQELAQYKSGGSG